MVRTSANVLTALPFVAAALMTAVDSAYMRPLWHTSRRHMLVAAALAMMVWAAVVLRRIGAVEGLAMLLLLIAGAACSAAAVLLASGDGLAAPIARRTRRRASSTPGPVGSERRRAGAARSIALKPLGDLLLRRSTSDATRNRLRDRLAAAGRRTAR